VNRCLLTVRGLVTRFVGGEYLKSALAAMFSALFLLSGCASSSSPTDGLTPNSPQPTFQESTPFDMPDYEASNCDPNYEGVCVSIVGFDLDFPEIQGPVCVVKTHIHGFDRDGDGTGCEPYT
jgi:hypothetical protein